jgi:hypothetical protein
MARVVNDRVDDEARQGMWPLIIRCLGTASDNKVLSVRLAIFCARSVLSIYEDEYPNDGRPRKALEAAEAWAECPCKDHAYAAAYAARAAYHAAYAARAAYHAAAAASASAYAAADASAYAARPAARIQLLTDLLDEYDSLTGRTSYEQPTPDAWERVLSAGSRA